MMSGLRICVAVTILIVLGCSQSLLAQVGAAQAQLNGVVRDQTGSVIVKAVITLRNVDSNQTYAASSNGEGYYIVTNVAPGVYDFSVEAASFAKHSQKGVVLRV